MMTMMVMVMMMLVLMMKMMTIMTLIIMTKENASMGIENVTNVSTFRKTLSKNVMHVYSRSLTHTSHGDV